MSGRRFTTHQHDNPLCKGLCLWPLRCDEERREAERVQREEWSKREAEGTPGIRFEFDDEEPKR